MTVPPCLWSDGQTLWILENAASGADSVFAYELEGGERQQDREFTLDRRNRFSHGIWSDGVTVWVADSGQDQLFAYDLEERGAGRSAGVRTGRAQPRPAGHLVRWHSDLRPRQREGRALCL